MDDGSLPPHFLGAGLPASFRRRIVTIGPHGHRRYDESEWRDAIVVVGRGHVDVLCSDESVLRFGEGDVLCLAGLPVRVLCNPGADDTVLVAIRRRRRGVRRPPGLVVELITRFLARVPHRILRPRRR
ncbi:hypothetical protein GCM10010106_05700 [Thermopolyspora flexuosa]|uniref:Cupin domain n=2 Tax=Thermopolyspora flexuosa TaxID=103836 RepID=A0A543IZ47_9ACTN|nr:hypothetical protein FHX40_2571 [Thermopolyspora flexuosa]GGM62570.1 hypothetical protein GCM10010106_05700 [Thermopolyspora flexuosa]